MYVIKPEMIVELVKQQGIGCNSPPPFFLVVTSSNPLVVVVCKPDATNKGFTNLHFGGAMVMDSPSKAVAMAQTEHFTADGNPDGYA
jgi:hypothetical protein